MQTISDLAKTIQQKTSERAENTEQIVQNELQKLEKSLQQRLSERERLISSCITDHEKSLQEKLNTALAFKNWLLIVIGVLLTLTLGLVVGNLWLYNKSQAITDEMVMIEQNIRQTPVQTKALARLDIGQNKDGTIWIQPKNPKKAKVGKDETNGELLLMLE